MPYNVQFTLISIPYYQKNFSSEYSYFLESRTTKAINETTKASFLNVWLRNFFLNFQFLENQEVKFLDFNKKVLFGKYVLFCGASPSLETQVEQIKTFRDKLFLISSDTSVSFLIQKKVYPDVILSIDSGRGTIFHLQSHLPNNSIFITWLGGNREIFLRKFKKYLFLSTFPLEQILQAYFLSELPILTNPSLNIAGMAKSIARELGAEKIIYAGTSFVSIYGKTHCKGTGYESYLLPKLNRKFALESYRKGYKEIKDSKNELAFRTIFQDEFVLSYEEVNLEELPNCNTIQIFALDRQINPKEFFAVLKNSPKMISSLIQDYSFPKKNLEKYLKFL